ncbi:MAG: hypothetical protein JWL83_124 [Actinomycetia bacterium]|nr:hypothetical protein [Actinomycetes bacterium]
MNLKKRLLAATGVATLVAMTAVSGPAFAASPPIDGTGTVGCTITGGKASFNPGLVSGGTATSEAIKIKITVTCNSGTGDGANVASGKISGTLHSNSNDCGNLLGPTAVTGNLTAKWKVDPHTAKLNPSVTSVSTITGGVDGTGHATFTTTGPVNSGSFNGKTANGNASTTQTAADLGAACSSSKGLKKINIANGGSLNIS